MKDRFEARLFLFAVPAIVVWELFYRFVIAGLFPAAAGNEKLHTAGFLVFAAVGWLIARRIAEGRDEDDGPGGDQGQTGGMR